MHERQLPQMQQPLIKTYFGVICVANTYLYKHTQTTLRPRYPAIFLGSILGPTEIQTDEYIHLYPGIRPNSVSSQTRYSSAGYLVLSVQLSLYNG